MCLGTCSRSTRRSRDRSETSASAREDLRDRAAREDAAAQELQWARLLEPVEDRAPLAERDGVDDEAILVDEVVLDELARELDATVGDEGFSRLRLLARDLGDD